MRSRRQLLKSAALLIAAEHGFARLAGLLLLDGALDADASLGAGRQSALHLAARGGHTTVVRLLIDRQAQLDAANANGETPIWVASARGHSGTVELLARAEAQVDSAASSGETPLHAAARSGRLATVQLLLASGAAVDARLPVSDETLLLSLCATGSCNDSDRIAAALIRAGADVDARSAAGRSPLSLACQRADGGAARLLTTLIGASADANSVCGPQLGETALALAARLGRTDAARQLLEAAAADPNPRSPSDGRTTSPLMSACRSGDARLVRLMVAAGVDVDRTDPFGYSPLALAAHLGHRAVVRALLDAQANLETRQLDGASAVYLAAQGHQRLAVLDTLIGAQADVDGATDRGYTPLHAAVRCRTPGAVSRLVRAQAAVNPRESRPYSPLHLAAHTGCADAVELLASTAAGADVDAREERGATPLYLAARSGSPQSVEALVRVGANVDAQTFAGESPLSAAVLGGADGNRDALDLLIRAQANPDSQRLDGTAAIHLAVEHDRRNAVRSLAAAGANLDVRRRDTGESALHLAARCGSVAMVTELVRAGADADVSNAAGSTPLALASESGHTDAVAVLIRAQASLDSQRRSGSSPMHLAAQFGHLGPMRQLIAWQASVDLRSGSGAAPIYLASQNGHAVAVGLLVEAQADSSAAMPGGFAPLFVASQNGHAAVVGRLLAARPDVDRRTSGTGSTALCIATQWRRAGVVQALVRAPADVNLRRWTTGETALHLAARLGDEGIARMLIGAPADVDIRASGGASAYQIALRLGHIGVAKALAAAQANQASADAAWVSPERSMMSEADFSLSLHSSLLAAGFHRVGAMIQCAISDVTEGLITSRLQDRHYIVGSFSEGWGSSLTCLDGKVDPDSSIRIVRMTPGRMVHIRGVCRCSSRLGLELVDLENGGVTCSDADFPPPRAWPASANRPAIDHVTVVACCRYPPIDLLDSASRGNSSSSSTHPMHPVLQELKEELLNSVCYVTPSTVPDEARITHRLSAAFLEKRLMRSLSTLQGQFFIVLKYIVRHLLSRTVKGLKIHLVKVLTFRMLNSTPALEWQPEKLVHLMRRALRMLQDGLSSSPGDDDHRCVRMTHLHLPDAADAVQSTTIIDAIEAVLSDLPSHLAAYAASLQPVTDNRLFRFHPFLIMPELAPSNGADPTDEDSITDYHQLYDAVKHLLHRLAGSHWSLAALLNSIDALPDCACTAAVTLRAMSHLRAGDLASAKGLIRRHLSDSRRPLRGLACPPQEMAGLTGGQALRLVTQHLAARDSIWKFCLHLEQPAASFAFLPAFARQHFPLELAGCQGLYLVNFDSLMKCLHCELMPDVAWSNRWFDELLGVDAADEQELLVTLRYCKSADTVQRIIVDNGHLLSQSCAAQAEKCRALQRLTHQRQQIAEALALDLINYFAIQRNSQAT